MTTAADAAWVRCGDAGGDAGRLLALIIEAIREALPGAVDVLAERMAATPEAVDPERAAGALGRELARCWWTRWCSASTTPRRWRARRPALAVAGAADRRRGAARCAWPSRPAARWPCGWPASAPAGRVAELGPAELAFSAADCEAYLRLARGREPLPTRSTR